jgi:hypothetical protein
VIKVSSPHLPIHNLWQTVEELSQHGKKFDGSQAAQKGRPARPQPMKAPEA